MIANMLLQRKNYVVTVRRFYADHWLQNTFLFSVQDKREPEILKSIIDLGIGPE